MSGLDNLRTRLSYAGGGRQESRMIEDKLRTLKKALIYSYQAATAELADGRQFKCLINPDKLNMDYDHKIISIPFEDICLNKSDIAIDVIDETSTEVKKEWKQKTIDGIEKIGMQVGDVFTWVETNTYWLVYLQRLEEDAYFRAEICKCDYEVEINGKKYRAYIKGPTQNSILWHTKSNVSWNDLNYAATMLITHDENTEVFFHRFMKIDINGKPWEVQSVDNLTTPGVIQIKLSETNQNSIAAAAELEAKAIEEQTQNDETTEQGTAPHIIGDKIVYPYDQKQYIIENAENGIWEISNTKKAIITYQTSEYANVTIVTGRSGNVELIYKRDNEEDIKLDIQISSL